MSHCHLVQVLDVIHHLDVVESLISEGTSTPEDWAWVKQLRYYKTGREGNAGVLVKMADAALDYSWEYQGNAPKLVYTPLTDRCYLTLTQVTDVADVPWHEPVWAHPTGFLLIWVQVSSATCSNAVTTKYHI